MAEPWNNDFVALDERSRTQLPSLAATRARVLSAQENHQMRLFKNRPFLVTLIVLALAGVASGTVYAVDRVFLSVDPGKSASRSRSVAPTRRCRTSRSTSPTERSSKA